MSCYWPFKKGNDPQPLPCGKCPYCRARRTSDWVFRCMMEARYSDSMHWVTLTYEHPPLSFTHLLPTLYKRDVQNFFKRLRRIPRDYSNRSIKYYLCGEYGSKNSRPHYHVIIFNSDIESIRETWRGEWYAKAQIRTLSIKSRYEAKDMRLKKKKPLFNVNLDSPIILGTSHFDEVNSETVAYTAEYMNKKPIIPQFDGDDRYPEFQLSSNELGLDWLTDEVKDYYLQNPDKMYVTMNGFKKPLPRYFVEKILAGADDLKLARAEYAVAMAEKKYEEQWNSYVKNGDLSLSFEQFRYQRKKTALELWRKKLKERKNLI